MVKNKNKKQKNGKKKTKNSSGGFTDVGKSLEVLYKQMVLNPCSGPLVPPPMPGGTGHLVRLTRRYTYADIISGMTDPSDTAYAFFVFSPQTGSFGYKAVSANNIPLDTAAGDDASTGLAQSYISRFGFLDESKVRRFRPVACCVDFKNFTASNSISGGFAVVTGGEELYQFTNDSANNPTPEQITPNVEFMRMPLDNRTIWRPKTTAAWTTYPDIDGSSIYRPATSTEGIVTMIRVNPSAGGVSNIDFDIVVTAIYEYEAEASEGIKQTQYTSPVKSTIESILANIPDDMLRYGSSMVKSAGKAAMNLGIQYFNPNFPPMPYQLTN